MRLRDVLMVVIAVGGLIFGWLQEGSLHLQRGFVVTIADTDVLIHNYPKPVVMDLYKNGKPVMIACPRADIIGIYPTYNARRNFENVFVHMSPTRQVQVYSTIVGIAAGNVNLNGAAEGTTIAVVTEDYRLEVFDSTLQSRWTANLLKINEAGIILHHAAISIVPERVYEQDKGTVIVSVQVSGANGTEHTMVTAYSGDSGEQRWKHVTDAYVLNNGGAPPDTTPSAQAIRDSMLMTSDALTERSSDLHWTHFREAVVASLPHTHSHSWDSTLAPHVFFHSKNRKKRKGHHGADGVGGTSEPKYKDRHVRLDTNDVGELGERVGLLGSGSSSRHSKKNTTNTNVHHHPNVLVVHGRDSIEVLHLYTGKRVTRVYPLKKNAVYHDVDDDFRIDEVKNLFGSHSSAHHKHGVDIVVDCLGIITSGAPLSQDVMYNATICDTEGLFSGIRFVSAFMHRDAAAEQPEYDALSLIGSRNVATETTHGVTPLVVQHHVRKGRDLFKIQRHALFMIDSGLVTCVDPVSKRIVWRAQTDAGFPDLRQAAAEEVSMGLHSEEEKENRLQRFPHLAKYSLHQHDAAVHSSKQRYRETDPFVLAVGETFLTALNARSGVVVETVPLEQTPVAPTLVVDFNGDGVNDVLVFSANSIYGFVVQQHAATSTIAMLMILMVGTLLALVIAREMRQQDGEDELPTAMRQQMPRRVKRSTD